MKIKLLALIGLVLTILIFQGMNVTAAGLREDSIDKEMRKLREQEQREKMQQEQEKKEKTETQTKENLKEKPEVEKQIVKVAQNPEKTNEQKMEEINKIIKENPDLIQRWQIKRDLEFPLIERMARDHTPQDEDKIKEELRDLQEKEKWLRVCEPRRYDGSARWFYDTEKWFQSRSRISKKSTTQNYIPTGPPRKRRW
jgi:5'-3' exonuclease